ncbi:MAG: hypothetical protein IJ532_05000 [Alphaproteobacteria bacterium]|nr:hypothetical protein [Alphaproteobacteria bacterium]
MKNNLNNKITVLIACAFIITVAGIGTGYAKEEIPSANQAAADVDISDELLGLDEIADDSAEENQDIDISSDGSEEKFPEVKDEIPVAPAEDLTSEDETEGEDTDDLNFLNEVSPEETFAPKQDNLADLPMNSDLPIAGKKVDEKPSMEKPAAVPSPLLDVQPFPDDDSLDSLETDANKAQIDSTAEVDDVIPEIGEAKSPFESFGNSVLSKVDNDLFNQMSNIEKQTTLLRLELRREELKSKVEALRAARLKAQQEEDLRMKAEEERAKDMEAERQAMIVAEQEKLKQKEIELEKVRQAQIVKDYMNEMLVVNQQWVAKNAELQKRIHELEEEKAALQSASLDKISQLNAKTAELETLSENSVRVFNHKMELLNNNINQLKSSMLEREDEIKQLSNPFSDNGTPGEDAIDMSKDYAIMDITGKGDDVIAKLVSRDGSTFIIHKGSKLRNGEVVTSITDHYISFDNNGVQSYLYTGGTVMEYEPMVTFNGSDKTPEQTDKQIIKGNFSNTFGKGAVDENAPVLIKQPKKTNGNLSFGSGTFVQ